MELVFHSCYPARVEHHRCRHSRRWFVAILRSPALILISAALVLTDCGSGPSKATSAAIVGERAISLDDVQSEIRWLFRHVPEVRDVDGYSSRIVASRVVHELAKIAAERENLAVDAAEIGRMIDELGGTDQAAKTIGLAPSRVRQLAFDQVVLEKLGEKYVRGLSVGLVGGIVPAGKDGATTKDAALALGRAIAANPEQADQRIKATGARAHQAVSRARRDRRRRVDGTRRQCRVRHHARQRHRHRHRATLGARRVVVRGTVEINPRYGQWDHASVTVAARSDNLAGHVLPARR